MISFIIKELTQLKGVTGIVFSTTFIENVEFISSQKTEEICGYLDKQNVSTLKNLRFNILEKTKSILPEFKLKTAPNERKAKIISDIIKVLPYCFTASPTADDTSQPEASRPEALQPETLQPEALQPVALQPEVEMAPQPWAKKLSQHLQVDNIAVSNDSPPPPPPPPSAAAESPAVGTAVTAPAAPEPSCGQLQQQINHLSSEMSFLQKKLDHSEDERAKLLARVKDLEKWLQTKFDCSESEKAKMTVRVKQLEEWTAIIQTPELAKILAFKTQVGNATIPAHTATSDTQVGATTAQVAQVAQVAPPSHLVTQQEAQLPATTHPAQPTNTSMSTNKVTLPPTPLNQPTVNPVHNTPAMPPTPLEQPRTELFISRMHCYDRDQMLKYINERVDLNLVLSDIQPLHVKNGSAFNVQVPTEKAEAVLAIWPAGITAEHYKRLGPNAFRGHQKYNQGPPRRNQGPPRRNQGPPRRNQGPPRQHRGPNRPHNGGPNRPSRRGNLHQQYQHSEYQTAQYKRYPPSKQQQQQQQRQRQQRHYQDQQGDNQYQDHPYPRWNDNQQRYQQYHQDRYH